MAQERKNIMNVSAFLANFQRGGLRVNRFRVLLTFPVEVGGAQSAQKISFTCHSSQIPASTLGVANLFYQGRTVKLAGDREFQPWEISVYLDNDLVSRQAFEKWSDLVNGHSSNVAIPGWGNPISYMADALVELMDNEGNVVDTYTMKQCFPSNIGQVQLDWESQNTIARMPVTMEYQYWESGNTLNK